MEIFALEMKLIFHALSAASLSKYKSNCRVTFSLLFAVNVRLAMGLVHSDKGKFCAVSVSDSGSSFEGFLRLMFAISGSSVSPV